MSSRAARYAIYLIILVAAVAVIRQNAWKIDIYRYQLDAQRLRRVTADPPGWEYYLHVPKGYTPERTWPVLVYVHGTEGSGRDALHVWRPLADREGFFFLAPTFPDLDYIYLANDEDRVLWEMIVEVQRQYAIDRDRVFVAGFSGGAQFAHRFAFRYPSHICGVSVMSAGSYDPPPSKARTVPFAVSVGEADAERLEIARWFAGQLRGKGYQVRYQAFPGVGHWMCAEAVDLTLDLFREITQGGGP